MSKFTQSQRAERCVLDLATACYQASLVGGQGAIAGQCGFNQSSFAARCNPNRKDKHLYPHHVEAIVGFTKDPRIMDAICAAHGGVGWFPLPDPNCGAGEIMQSIGDMGQDFGSLMQTCMEALADGRISSDELSQLQKSGNQLISAVQGALEQARIKSETFDIGSHGFGGANR